MTAKPDTRNAMIELMAQIRERFPFSLSKAELCEGGCQRSCSLKLLEYMDMELSTWEQRLEAGETPNFADIQQLAKSAKKIHRVLETNHLLPNA